MMNGAGTASDGPRADDRIDTDIQTSPTAIARRFYRPVTQSVTIRLNAPDLEAARQHNVKAEGRSVPDVHQPVA